MSTSSDLMVNGVYSRTTSIWRSHMCTIHPCAERTSGDHVLVTLMESTQVKCAASHSISGIQ